MSSDKQNLRRKKKNNNPCLHLPSNLYFSHTAFQPDWRPSRKLHKRTSSAQPPSRCRSGQPHPSSILHPTAVSSWARAPGVPRARVFQSTKHAGSHDVSGSPPFGWRGSEKLLMRYVASLAAQARSLAGWLAAKASVKAEKASVDLWKCWVAWYVSRSRVLMTVKVVFDGCDDGTRYG
jgi:hypothetical protein